MRLLVHTEGSPTPRVIETEKTLTVSEVIEKLELGGEEYVVYRVDAEEELAVEERLDDDDCELAVARKAKDDVTVVFNAEPIEKKWPPQRKVSKIFAWAVGEKGFDLPRDQRPEYELAVEGATDPADADAPISAYADAERRITFDLRRKDAFAG